MPGRSGSPQITPEDLEPEELLLREHIIAEISA